MAGARYTFTLDDVQVQATFQRLIIGGADARPLFTEIGSALEGSTRQRFQDKESPDGIPWIELRPATQAAKRGPGILVERGDLLASVAFEAGPDFVQIIAGPTAYAAVHQFGGSEGMAPGAAAIPARPYLGVSDEDETEINEAAADWLGRLLAGP